MDSARGRAVDALQHIVTLAAFHPISAGTPGAVCGKAKGEFSAVAAVEKQRLEGGAEEDQTVGDVHIAGLGFQRVPNGSRDITPRTDGPFNVLEWADGVTTSRSGYAVWVSITSTAHRAQIPDHEREVEPPEHRAALHVSCLAVGGDLANTFPPVAAQGRIYLDNHPEQRDAYQVWHPMYWILGLSGESEERWPIRVRLNAGEAIASELVRPRTDYSAPRPGLDIDLPGQQIVDAIAAGDPIEIEATGPQMRLIAQFTAPANAQRAARLMLETCPDGP